MNIPSFMEGWIAGVKQDDRMRNMDCMVCCQLLLEQDTMNDEIVL